MEEIFLGAVPIPICEVWVADLERQEKVHAASHFTITDDNNVGIENDTHVAKVALVRLFRHGSTGFHLEHLKIHTNWRNGPIKAEKKWGKKLYFFLLILIEYDLLL